MKNQIITAIKFIAAMTILTGIVYPLIITIIAKLFFTEKANGSLIRKNGIVIGSKLIGQNFDTTVYFWSRPSATDYNTLPSGGSNLGPSSRKLRDLAEERKSDFINKNLNGICRKIPEEMIFASGSGIDPHISPEAALLQINRIVNARNFNAEQKQKLISIIGQLTEKPQFLILGEERINVLLLNLELDKIK